MIPSILRWLLILGCVVGFIWNIFDGDIVLWIAFALVGIATFLQPREPVRPTHKSVLLPEKPVYPTENDPYYR